MTAPARRLLTELVHIHNTWPTGNIEQAWGDDGLHVRVTAVTGGGVRVVDQRTVTG